MGKRVTVERRYDNFGELRLMAEVDGWIMCRRPPRWVPFVVSREEWDAKRREPLKCT